SVATKCFGTEHEVRVADFVGRIFAADTLLAGAAARAVCYARAYTIMGGTPTSCATSSPSASLACPADDLQDGLVRRALDPSDWRATRSTITARAGGSSSRRPGTLAPTSSTTPAPSRTSSRFPSRTQVERLPDIPAPLGASVVSARAVPSGALRG